MPQDITDDHLALYRLRLGDNLLGFDDRYPRRYYWFDDAQGPSRTCQYPYLVRRYSLTTTLRF